jgi:hypothetical protein
MKIFEKKGSNSILTGVFPCDLMNIIDFSFDGKYKNCCP